MNDRDNTSFITGLLLGTVVGLAIGFLYAPQPGKETRKLLKEKAEIAKQKAAGAAEQVKQTASETTKKLKAALE